VTTATDTTGLESLHEGQALVRARLARLHRRLRLETMLEIALDATAALVVTAALLVLLDWWFRPDLPARNILLAVAVAVLLPVLAIRAARRWVASRLDDLSLAMTLDRFRPGTGGRVVDVLQLPELLSTSPESVSPAMVRVAFRRAMEALDASDWWSLWNRKRTAVCVSALLGALLVPTAFALVAPGAARLSVARWLLGSNERWPQKTYMTIAGLGERHKLLAPRDEPFALEVRADLPGAVQSQGGWHLPGRGESFLLRTKPASPRVPRDVYLRERPEKGPVRAAALTATGPASFRHELPPSTASTTIELTGGDDWLGPIPVERVDRPSLATTRLRAREPGSPGNELRPVAEGVQHPTFLPDTEIELTLVGSEPIAEARLTVHPGTSPKLTRKDLRTFVANWTLKEATTLEISLTSGVTGLTSKPAFLSLGLMRDREPRVTLRALGVGGHVTPVATIPLSLAATDDRGLASVRLQFDRTTPPSEEKAEAKTSRQTVPIPLPTSPDGGRAVLDHQARHDFELQVAPPAVGTILKFVGEAEDRCARGVQLGRSAAVQMMVVAPDELFYEILMRQRAERTKFLGVLETVEKRSPSLGGAPSRDEYATVMRGLHSGSRQLDLIAGRIADTLQEMKLNKIGSPKSHRLLQEGVIDPIRALLTGPMTELRGVLQALSGTGPRGNADPNTARRLHAEVVARMHIILDQMSQWESFVDVVNQVAEVIKMQQNVLQATEKARESRTREVFDAKP
jgi:hypothetical protein